MKFSRKISVAIVGAAMLSAGAGLVGCSPTDPQTATDIDQAFTAMCAYLPALGPVVSQLNSQIQGDYATAQTICAAGSPTSPVAAGVDILAVYLALEPYFVHSASATPAMKAEVRHVNAALKARGLM